MGGSPRTGDHRWSAACATFWNRAGAVFVNGKLVERPDETPQPEAA
jgi:hypothetical protein